MYPITYACLVLMLSMTDLFGTEKEALQTVSNVDLKRYTGTWYEIARLRDPWIIECALNTTATYTLLDDGNLQVVNQCQTGKNLTDVQKIDGTAKVIDKKTYAKLNISYSSLFLPKWAFAGDYWIIQLADDYSYAVVSEPTEKHLWILSRTPTLPQETYQNILDKTALQMPNLNVLNIMRTEQKGH